MDTLPDVLYGKIIGFLSTKDKITMREVAKIYKHYVKDITLSIYRLENNTISILSTEKKLARDLVLTVNNNFEMYTDNKPAGIHSLFRVNNRQYDKCINVNCRGKKLGNIYFSKQQRSQYHQHHHSWNFYTKLNIPYCIHCFNRWG